MSIPLSIFFKNLFIPLLVAAPVLFALTVMTGCGGGQVAKASTDEARRPANVIPAKLPPLQIRKLPSGNEVISLDSDLYFAFDSARLTAAARSQLRGQVLPRVVAFLAKPGGEADLRGYTDGVGEAAYNLRLSQERAASARGLLIEAGAPPGRLVANGFGEELASSSQPDEALRRVDVVLRRRGSR